MLKSLSDFINNVGIGNILTVANIALTSIIAIMTIRTNRLIAKMQVSQKFLELKFDSYAALWDVIGAFFDNPKEYEKYLISASHRAMMVSHQKTAQIISHFCHIHTEMAPFYMNGKREPAELKEDFNDARRIIEEVLRLEMHDTSGSKHKSIVKFVRKMRLEAKMNRISQALSEKLNNLKK